MDTKPRTSGLLSATSILQLSIEKLQLSVGKERGKEEVEKGLWADGCSAMYGFIPGFEVYLEKSGHR